MAISLEDSTEDLVEQVMSEKKCSYEEAIKLLLELTQDQNVICLDNIQKKIAQEKFGEGSLDFSRAILY